MADVEDRQPPLALEAETVLREQRVAAKRTDAAAVVFRFRERVTGEHRQSLLEPPRELDRQGVVFGFGDVPDLLDFRVLRIGLPALYGSEDPGSRFVPIEHAFQTI